MVTIVEFVGLSDAPLPLSNHTLFLLLSKKEQHERLVKMEDEEYPEDSYPVLTTQSGKLPEGVPKWILEETRDVLERSPLLSHISWFHRFISHLSKVSIGVSCESSKYHDTLIIKT